MLFTFTFQCNHASSSQKANDDFGAQPNKHPVFTYIFGIVGILENIGQDINVLHNGSKER